MSANPCSGRLKLSAPDGETCFLKAWPIEEMSGISFPVRRDVLMTGNGLNRVMFGNGGQQGLQAGVLCFGKRLEIAAFQFDTDGKGIAFFSA